MGGEKGLDRTTEGDRGEVPTWRRLVEKHNPARLPQYEHPCIWGLALLRTVCGVKFY